LFGKLKHIAPLFFLWVFLYPTVVKFEHHHEHKHHDRIKGVALKSYEGKCEICKFEFSVFTPDSNQVELPRLKPTDRYVEFYTSPDKIASADFTFLLRAPPFRQI
jgi:hypothetical protein